MTSIDDNIVRSEHFRECMAAFQQRQQSDMEGASWWWSAAWPSWLSQADAKLEKERRKAEIS